MHSGQVNPAKMIPSNMDLFSRTPVNVGEQGFRGIKYYPNFINKDSNQNIEFHIPQQPTMYVDMSRTEIVMRLKLVDEEGNLIINELDGNDLTADLEERSAVVPVDNVLHTMFSSIVFKCGEQTIGLGGTNYHYKAFIESVLENNLGGKSCHTHKSGFSHQFKYPSKDGDYLTNSQYIKRMSWFVKGKAFFQGRLHLDIGKQRKNLITNLPISVIFTQNPDAFRLMTFPRKDITVGKETILKNKTKPRIIIEDIHLVASCASPTSELYLFHEKTLVDTPILYELKDSTITFRGIDSGAHSVEYEDLFNNKVPTQMIIGMVDEEAYSGTYHSNPYLFQDFDIASLGFTVDGIPTPCEPMNFNFKEGDFMEGLISLYRVAGTLYNSDNIGLDRRPYSQGCALFGLNIDPTFAVDYSYVGMEKKGRTRLTLRFHTPLAKRVAVLIYANFPRSYEVRSDRNVREYNNPPSFNNTSPSFGG